MNIKHTLIAACIFAALPLSAQTLSKDQYKVQKDQIEATYKSEKAACDAQTGNAKDICVETAKGKEKVAKAELEYALTAKADDKTKVAVAKADADYEVAKEQCDDKSGKDKSDCKTTAKETHKVAVNAAKGK